MSFKLLSSPLQGYTDFRFRNAFNKCFEGIDTFYAPYIRITEKLEIKPIYERDILLGNNTGLTLVPQIMTNNASEFVFLARYVQKIGYKEINWNLGCPYPMVINRGLGAGLMSNPVKIGNILREVQAESDIIISIKMRLGNKSTNEIFDVLQILETYPLKNIIIHPRIAKQMYKGEIDLCTFERCIGLTSHKIIYNGDITSVARFNELAERFPMVDQWMIGRGIIADPFLASMIKSNTSTYPDDWKEQFSRFHDILFHEYSQALSGSDHIVMKMSNLWEYFISLFPNSPKGLKKIKKAKSIEAYKDVVREILSN